MTKNTLLHVRGRGESARFTFYTTGVFISNPDYKIDSSVGGRITERSGRRIKCGHMVSKDSRRRALLRQAPEGGYIIIVMNRLFFVFSTLLLLSIIVSL